MAAILMFLDECEDRQGARNFSLTGLLVPADRYQAVRSSFYERLAWLIVPTPGTVRIAPPELHGGALLPDGTDERKIEACRSIADLVIAHELAIFRVGYCLDSPGIDLFAQGPPPWLGLCWFGLLSVVAARHPVDLLLPVMDGHGAENITREMSQPTQTMAVMCAAGHGESVSIANSHNVGETFYADSRYSVCPQMADVVSYLRHVNDWARLGLTLPPFKQELLPIARLLDPSMRYEKTIILRRVDDAV